MVLHASCLVKIHYCMDVFLQNLTAYHWKFFRFRLFLPGHVLTHTVLAYLRRYDQNTFKICNFNVQVNWSADVGVPSAIQRIVLIFLKLFWISASAYLRRSRDCFDFARIVLTLRAACTYVRTCVRTYVHTCVRTYVRTSYVRTYVCTYVTYVRTLTSFECQP